jgi:hypothetical protein
MVLIWVIGELAKYSLILGLFSTGKSLDLFFISKDSTQRIGVLAADEGFFKSNQWIATRRLNGDETHASTWDGTGIKMPDDKPGMQKIILYHYR